MNTNADRLAIAAAAVTGARHLRDGRNGQDAVATWRADGVAVAVVSDGCGSACGSEVGARLGASMFACSLGERLRDGQRVDDEATWAHARRDVVSVIAEIATHACPNALHDQLLFTIVAAAASDDNAAVWILGDGAYAFDDDAYAIGPFPDNAPPYIAYDLLGTPGVARFEIAPPAWRSIVIATDGAHDLGGLAHFADERYVTHADALRRELAVASRTRDLIDWDARRIARTPARLQDDCAIAILRRSAP
jgi:hypothetical protein